MSLFKKYAENFMFVVVQGSNSQDCGRLVLVFNNLIRYLFTYSLFIHLFAGDGRSGWMMNRIRDGHKFYFNAHQMAYSWEKMEEMKKDYSLLTRDEIQVKNVVN